MNPEWPALAGGEIELTVDGERLWRQAAPTYLELDGTLSYLVFRPMSRDGGRLSVRRESSVTAKEAYDNHVELGRGSLGTLAVEVGHVRGDAGLRAIDDSAAGDDLPNGHAYIDFRRCTKRETNTAAELLLRQALGNGWAYKPS